MSWQLLTAISVLGLSSSVILQRILLHKDKTDPYAYAVVFQAIVGVLLIGFAVYYGFDLSGIETMLLPAVICVVAYGIGSIVYAKTLQKVEASAFSVLFATQAIWIMLLGILLFNEAMTILQIVGSVLIFASVGLLVKNVRHLSLSSGIFLGLFTGAIYAVAITCWSYVGRHVDTLSWAAISFFGAALVALMIQPKSVEKMKPLLSGRLLPKLLLLGVFYGIGSVAMLFAYKEGTFTLVTPLRQTGIIVTTLLALLFITQERNRFKRKILAAVVCFLGVLLIIL